MIERRSTLAAQGTNNGHEETGSEIKTSKTKSGHNIQEYRAEGDSRQRSVH